MQRDTTLSQALFGADTRLKKALMVLGGSAFIAIAAQVTVPMLPVPMTLQTLAILMVGLSFGARMGAATLIAYLAQGAAGLPVFAAGGFGPASLVGPTAGFLFGFVAMAYLAGLVADRGVRGPVQVAAAMLAISALLYVPGLAWPALTMGVPADALVSGWMAPFLVGDAIKAVLAALIVTGGWTALKKRQG